MVVARTVEWIESRHKGTKQGQTELPLDGMIKRGPVKVGLNHPQPLFSLLLIPFLLPSSPSDTTFISQFITETSLDLSIFFPIFFLNFSINTTSACESPTLPSQPRTGPRYASHLNYMTDVVRLQQFRFPSSTPAKYQLWGGKCSARHQFATPTIQLPYPSHLPYLNLAPNTRDHGHGWRPRASRTHATRFLYFPSAS
jgi:hypothetical protein